MALAQMFRPGGAMLIGAGALLGLGLIVFGMMRLGADSAPRSAPIAMPDRRITNLVTAARPIGRGHLIEPGDLMSTAVIGRVPSDAILSGQDAVGKVAIADIQPQQLILNSLVSDDPAAAGLAMLVPVGQRVISIDTTDEIAVGGFLRPGDLVDIAIVLPSEAFGPGGDGPDRSESRTLLQNIKVLTVGATLDTANDKAAASTAKPAAESRALTLAMLPDQIELFTLARKLGRFFLVLRNPNDRAVAPTGRAGLPSLRGGDVPRGGGVPTPAAAARRPAPSRPIELIVGGQRQIIYPGASGR